MSAPDPSKFENIQYEDTGDPTAPYRCIRTFVEPGTSKIIYKEYICYPPDPCPPIEPTLIPPPGCECNPCEDCKSAVCEAVKKVREKRYGLCDPPTPEEAKRMLECQPVTVCVPVPEPRPPNPCPTCPPGIKYNPLAIKHANPPKVVKHFFKTHKEMKKQREKWEAKEIERKMKIKRFC